MNAHCDPLQSIMVLICIALRGNWPIPYSHYPEEIQLRLMQGDLSLSFKHPPSCSTPFLFIHSNSN